MAMIRPKVDFGKKKKIIDTFVSFIVYTITNINFINKKNTIIVEL